MRVFSLLGLLHSYCQLNFKKMFHSSLIFAYSGGELSALVKTKAACSASVGQSGKHSLQSQHSLEAMSGMKLISFLVPLSTNPTAYFFLTSAQYLTHRPQ